MNKTEIEALEESTCSEIRAGLDAYNKALKLMDYKGANEISESLINLTETLHALRGALDA